MPSLSSLRRPLAVLAGSAALLLPLSAAAQNAIITQPAQLFAGPAPDYPVIAAVYPGLEVSVIGCLADYMWCDVVLQDGLRGWAYGPSLAYGWMGNALPVPDYGPSLGIPLVTFFIGDYWGRHYRHQPWFDEYRWRQLPPPPPRFIPPPHHHDGRQAPYPPRWVQPGMPPRDDRRDDRWNDRRDDRWRGNDQPRAGISTGATCPTLHRHRCPNSPSNRPSSARNPAATLIPARTTTATGVTTAPNSSLPRPASCLHLRRPPSPRRSRHRNRPARKTASPRRPSLSNPRPSPSRAAATARVTASAGGWTNADIPGPRPRPFLHR